MILDEGKLGRFKLPIATYNHLSIWIEAITPILAPTNAYVVIVLNNLDLLSTHCPISEDRVFGLLCALCYIAASRSGSALNRRQMRTCLRILPRVGAM